MPSSDPSNIGTIIKIVQGLKPKSILDVGIGNGKYGLLFREYLDGHEQGCAVHDKDSWKIWIQGLEVFEKYISPVQQYIYNDIRICDAYTFLMEAESPSPFDLVFMGDFIEHLEKDEGHKLLVHIGQSWLKDNGIILLSTPNFITSYNHPKCAVFGNQYEIHRCRWFPKDFNIPGFNTSVVEGKLLTVTMTKK